MPDSSDLEAVEQALIDAAQAPASVSAGGTSVTEHPLPDQIAADKYLAEKRAVSQAPPGFGLRTARAKPPGASPC